MESSRLMSRDTSMNVKSVDMLLANDVTFIYGMSQMVSHLENTIGMCEIDYLQKSSRECDKGNV